jgi:SAM-dependent methyltransferase
MHSNDRALTLRRLHDAPLRLTSSLETVRNVDAFLASTFGIADPTSFAELERALENAATTDRQAARILRVLEERNVAHAKRRNTAQVDARFFDLMAVMPYAGWIHQLKRPYILDAMVGLTALVTELDIRGPTLDIGCHIGYHALWLSKHANIPVTGVDRSKRAMTLAGSIAESHAAPVQFTACEFPSVSASEPFEFIYSVDGPFFFNRFDAKTAAFFRNQLIEGGVFAVIGEGAPPFAQINKIAQQYDLYPMLSDVVGGWMGDEFSGASLLVFVKSATPLVIPPTLDSFDAVWDFAFRTYANLSNTPWREKTQAYCRARAIDHSGHQRQIVEVK